MQGYMTFNDSSIVSTLDHGQNWHKRALLTAYESPLCDLGTKILVCIHLEARKAKMMYWRTSLHES
jgi:hypothetical protein